MEIFKNIENYENLYQVSNYGRVYSIKRGKFLKPGKNNGGYLQIGLCKNNKRKNYLVHRLVASAFIPNTMNYKEVNHINEVKSENFVENLEWCTAKYNSNYGSRTQRLKEKQSKTVLQFTKDGKFVKEYPSVHEAERKTKISHGNISQCCLGKRHSAGKYLWKFKEEEVA